jgi:hypothetical protein
MTEYERGYEDGKAQGIKDGYEMACDDIKRRIVAYQAQCRIKAWHIGFFIAIIALIFYIFGR